VWVLKILAASNLVGKVHILSHSMGTRIASSALQVVLRQEKNENLMKKIGLYMFKQSDEQIVNMTETLKMLSDVKTETLEMPSDEKTEFSGCIPVILSHKNDEALKISKWIHGGLDRVGQFDEETLYFYLENSQDQEAVKRIQKELLGTEPDWNQLINYLTDAKDNITIEYAKNFLSHLIDIDPKKITDQAKAKKWLDKNVKYWQKDIEKEKRTELRKWMYDQYKNRAIQKSDNVYPRLQKANVFRRNGEDGHSYFTSEIFVEYLADAVWVAENGGNLASISPIGNLGDFFVALIRYYQQYPQAKNNINSNEHGNAYRLIAEALDSMTLPYIPQTQKSIERAARPLGLSFIVPQTQKSIERAARPLGLSSIVPSGSTQADTLTEKRNKFWENESKIMSELSKEFGKQYI
jgi:hypothetical protein